jgi:hypothetical protein
MEKSGGFNVVANCFTDFIDSLLDCAVCNAATFPNLTPQPIPRHNLAAMFEEKNQNVERGRRQAGRLIGTIDLPVDRVNPKFPES